MCFWESEVYVRESASFQLSLSAPPGVTLSFSSLAIYFTDEVTAPLIVEHSPYSSSHDILPGSVQRVSLGDVSAFSGRLEANAKIETGEMAIEANLRWNAGSVIVFTGTMSSDVPAILKVRGYFPLLA